jgi:hypothetical protein
MTSDTGAIHFHSLAMLISVTGLFFPRVKQIATEVTHEPARAEIKTS